MSTNQVDYDRIAPSYNLRFTGGSVEGVAGALWTLVEAQGARQILEVGCGTGHWLAGIHGLTGRLYGLDLSAGMLAQAQQRPEPLHLARGRAEQLPFPEASFDLVYSVNAIHHFQRQPDFVAEAWRLLRPGGVLAVIGTDPRFLRDRWYIYDYFERTYETDLARFPSWGTVLDWLVAAGFERVAWQPVEQIRDHKVGRAVLADPFLRKDACSQLALLSDEAYTAGLQRIEDALAAAEARGETLTFATDLLLTMLAGWVGA